jgi:hypothetical protein
MFVHFQILLLGLSDDQWKKSKHVASCYIVINSKLWRLKVRLHIFYAQVAHDWEHVVAQLVGALR